jgi:hypothetical protein
MRVVRLENVDMLSSHGVTQKALQVLQAQNPGHLQLMEHYREMARIPSVHKRLGDFAGW